MGLVVSCATSVVTSCVTACACCACSELCHCCIGGCCTTDNGSGHDTKRGSTTIKYFVLFTLSVVAAIVLRYRNNGVINLYTLKWDACSSNECVGYGTQHTSPHAQHTHSADRQTHKNTLHEEAGE